MEIWILHPMLTIQVTAIYLPVLEGEAYPNTKLQGSDHIVNLVPFDDRRSRKPTHHTRETSLGVS